MWFSFSFLPSNAETKLGVAFEFLKDHSANQFGLAGPKISLFHGSDWGRAGRL